MKNCSFLYAYPNIFLDTKIIFASHTHNVADSQNVIAVVTFVTVAVTPVKRVILLSVEEENFIVGIFCGVKFSVIGFGIFNGKTANIHIHITHHGVDRAGGGVRTVPIQ